MELPSPEKILLNPFEDLGLGFASTESTSDNSSPAEDQPTPRAGARDRADTDVIGNIASGVGCVGASLGVGVLNVLSPFLGGEADSGSTIRFRIGDLNNEEDAKQVRNLLDCYARDPMGIGESLPASVMEMLIPGLKSMKEFCIVYFAIIDYVDETSEIIAMAITFVGYSTFSAKRLLNVHDFVVHPDHRGKQVGQRLMNFIAQDCNSRGFCKITLEVLSGNKNALRCYTNAGFEPYQLQQESGHAMFLTRKLQGRGWFF